MMTDDLGRFMSEEERKQMDEIIAKAVKRKEMGKEEGTHFMALHCQVEQYTHESARGAEPSDDEVKQLLREICMKCCEHGCCHFVGNTEEEEDLPFPKESDEETHKTEIKKAVQSGRLAMLFSLVDSGKLTMEEAEVITAHDGYSIEETRDMYEGWKISQDM